MDYYARVRQHWDDDAVPVHADLSLSALRAFADELLDIAKPSGAERVLDVGCGDGQLSSLLRPNVGRLDGVDVSEQRLEHARHRMPDGTFRAQSFLDPYPAGPYDIVWSWSVVQYCRPADIDLLIGRSRDVLRDGGRIVHGDVVDRARLSALYRGRGVKDLAAHALAGLLPKRPIWRDGSHAHDLRALQERLQRVGLQVELLDARCPYRSHIVITLA